MKTVSNIVPTHVDTSPTTYIYSSCHLAAKVDVLAASVERPKCLTRSCILPISKFTKQLTTITTWQQTYSHVTGDPRMLLYISINLLLGDWRVHETGLPGQKPISDVTHGTFVALACSGRPIPLPGKTYNNISIHTERRAAHLETSHLLPLIHFPCNHKRTVWANWPPAHCGNPCLNSCPNGELNSLSQWQQVT